ncbi:hypothetical protein BJV82DRAFT_617414 [Fennellomyces sp. T-0311]|nr:hypothetical protein BJV82DRAFT_617414 [Fennellomyces sp. T-0311]
MRAYKKKRVPLYFWRIYLFGFVPFPLFVPWLPYPVNGRSVHILAKKMSAVSYNAFQATGSETSPMGAACSVA